MEQSGINVELYRLFEPVRQGRIRIRGKEFSLTELRDEVMKQLAGAIIGDMERLWVEDWDLEFILLTGGGAEDLAPILEKQLEGQTRVISTESDMRMINVVGYLKYAKYIDLMEKRRQMPGGEEQSALEEETEESETEESETEETETE